MLMTRKNLIAVILAAGCLGGVSASAQETSPVATAPEYSFTVSPSFVSTYMFRGVRLGGASFQPSVELDAANWGVGVWSNFPLESEDYVSDPEADVYGFYNFTVSDGFDVSPGFTWYNYPNAVDGAYKSTFEPSLAASYTFKGVKLTPKLYYDMVMHGPTYEFTAAYALPLTELGTELDFTASVGTYMWRDSADDVPANVKNWGDYWLVGVSAPFTVTTNSKLTVGVAYTEGSNNYIKEGTDHRYKNDAAVGRGVATITYAYTF